MGRPHLGDPAAILAIREMAFAGMFDREIAYEFLVSRVAITKIVNGNAYTSHPGPIRGRDYIRIVGRTISVILANG